MVAGVSGENGLEGFYIQPKSIDSDAFIQYLLGLLSTSKASTFTVFMDNCRVHHSKKVAEFIKQNDIDVIFNVAYSPQYNAIERVWAQYKILYKKARLELIIEEKSPNYEKLVRKIMLSLPSEKIRSICTGTMRSKLGV